MSIVILCDVIGWKSNDHLPMAVSQSSMISKRKIGQQWTMRAFSVCTHVYIHIPSVSPVHC